MPIIALKGRNNTSVTPFLFVVIDIPIATYRLFDRVLGGKKSRGLKGIGRFKSDSLVDTSHFFLIHETRSRRGA